MSRKIFWALMFVIYFAASLEAASLQKAAENTKAVIQKLDYEGVEANVRSARQTYTKDDSDEDSDEDDEDDEEDEAEQQHQAVINRQQAYEKMVDDSQEGSDEDSQDNFEEDDDEYDGRRIRRDVPKAVSSNEIEEYSQPSKDSENEDNQQSTETSSTSSPALQNSKPSNTSVLILIRDVIKKVTELPNSQQVATSAQQYFQLFEHFLQETIKQVLGDDDEEDEVESSTFVPEKETVTETSDTTDIPNVSETTSDKETSVKHEVPQSENSPEVSVN